jgi:hypothetical protein
MSGVVLIALVLTQCGAVLLLVSSVGHTRAPRVLDGALRAHGLLNARMIRSVVHALPWVQASVGAAVIASAFVAGPSAKVAAGVQCGLFVVFAGYLARLVRAGGASLECGCAGATSGDARSALRRACVVTVASAIASYDGAVVVTPAAPQWVLAAVTVVVGAMLALFGRLIDPSVTTAAATRYRQREEAA